jgi:hypothetical protein
LIEFVGGRASLCGHSSGANLAIEATLPVESLAVYEPAFVVDDGRPRRPTTCSPASRTTACSRSPVRWHPY